MITPAHHSAHVTLEFRNATARVPLAQLAVDFAIPIDSVELPPCEGEIYMCVDGRETRMPVFLPQGIQAQFRRFTLASIES